MPMLVSLVSRTVINLIHQGTSPSFQEQIGLLSAARTVGIGEECQKKVVENVAG